MKKILSILLIAVICCAAVCAADVAAKVKLYMSYSENGFSFVPNAGTWEPFLSFSFGNDVGKAGIVLAFPNYDNIAFKTNYEIKMQKDGKEFIISIGSDVNVSYKEGITSNTSYGVITVNKDVNKYKLGFGHKPNTANKVAKEADVFFFAEVNQKTMENNFLHLDAMTKLNFTDGQADLKYVLGDATWSYGKELTGPCIVKKVSEFGWNEDVYFNRRDYSWDPEIITGIPGKNVVSAGARYKYYTEEEMEKYNGLYGYGWARYINNGFIYEAEAEAGKAIKFEVGSSGAKTDKFSEIVYARADFDFTGDEVDAKLTEVYSRLTLATKAKDISDWSMCFTPKFTVNYYNKDTNTAAANGLFITPSVDIVYSAYNIGYGLKLGLDSLNKFHWSSDLSALVSF